MWFIADDSSKPVITAEKHVRSPHRACHMQLPETAVVFFLGYGTEYLAEKYHAEKQPELFPRFLNSCPVWTMTDPEICFLNGGGGAPQAADTVETLAVLGVKNIIAVGLCGGFSGKVQPGEIITPEKAFVEEGTSLHYFESAEAAYPDPEMLRMTADRFAIRTWPIVSTDAVYRQTFRKEQLWRDQGAVAADMEVSAVFNVARYLGLRAVALMMISDIHPETPDGPRWEWKMTREMRYRMADHAADLARELKSQPI